MHDSCDRLPVDLVQCPTAAQVGGGETNPVESRWRQLALQRRPLAGELGGIAGPHGQNEIVVSVLEERGGQPASDVTVGPGDQRGSSHWCALTFCAASSGSGQDLGSVPYRCVIANSHRSSPNARHALYAGAPSRVMANAVPKWS